MAIRMFVYLSLVAFAVALAGCSMTDDVRDAKNTSENMDRKLSGMVDTSDNLLDRTSNLFAGARKDLSFTRVTERYEDILNVEPPTLKILYASALARSYAFQQWTGTRQDTPDLKNAQINDSLRDFLYRFEPLVDHEKSPDTRTWRLIPWYSEKEGIHRVAVPLMPGNQWKSAASMSVALGELDPDQLKSARISGVPAESLYSLIVKGLQYKNKSLYSKNIPDYARQVLGRQGEAIYLLQLRHNYFLAMVMSRFTDFCTAAPLDNLLPTAFSRQLKEAWNWLWVNRLDYDMTVRNVDNLVKVQDEALLWLQMAQETQGVLEMLGQKLLFNSGIQQLFAKFHIDKPKSWAGLMEVEDTFKQLDQVTAELQWTYRTKKAGAHALVPSYLKEPAALLTPAELEAGLLPEYRTNNVENQ